MLLLLPVIGLLGACSHSRHPNSLWYDPNDPGYEFAPAMYHSWAYEPLTQVTDKKGVSWYYNSSAYNDFKGKYNMNMLKPVANTVARGKMDYYFPYENNDAGRALAAGELKNPNTMDANRLAEGKRLYNLYCDHCHNENGNGQGVLVTAGKFPTMGEYYNRLKDRTEGSIYHTIYHGRGLMGAHASQLSPEQIWLITDWVKVLQQSDNAYTTSTLEEYNVLMGIQ